MRVLYLGDPDRKSRDRLTAQAEYVVLSVWIPFAREASLRVLEDRTPRKDWQTPILVRSSLFQVTSAHAPASWRIDIGEGFLELGPEPFLRPGFWEAWLDTENPEHAQAKIEYEEQLEILLEEDRRARESGQ